MMLLEMSEIGLEDWKEVILVVVGIVMIWMIWFRFKVMDIPTRRYFLA